MELLFIVAEYDKNLFINKDHIKKRFKFNDHPSYVLMENHGKLSLNYHQILNLSVLLTGLI